MTDLYQEPLHMSTPAASFIDNTITKQAHLDYANNMKNNTTVNNNNNNNKHETDSAVSQLLARLDEGTQTIANLRSILTLKTAELNELMAQLEMTNQAITNVESTTGHIETMLKELGLSSALSCGSSTTGTDGPSTRDLLISAEASLDSAIKSAIHIYSSTQDDRINKLSQQQQPIYKHRPIGNHDHPAIPSNSNNPGGYENKSPQTHSRFVSRIRYKPDTKHLLRQLTDRLRDLELDAGKFFETIGTTTDVQALQKAYVDLDLAETIALSAKSNLKRRKILLTSSRKRNGVDQVKLLGDKIREGVDMWKTYTRNAPMKVNGEDILVILELQDNLLGKNVTNQSSRMSVDLKSRSNSPTNSTSSSTTHSTSNHRYSSTTWRQNTSSQRPENSTTGRHRSSSISSVSSIPVLTSHPPPPLPQQPSAYHPKKTGYRHSTTSNYANNNSSSSNTILSPRAPIKANLGVNRVRTSSLTNKTKDHFISSAKVNLPLQPSNINNASTTTTAATVTATTTSPYESTTTSTMTNAAGVPQKTMLKIPSQRGPGSTLRIRSMLAKRNHQLPSSSSLSKLGQDIFTED
ncbi:hypothetical protein BC941DRAFT_441537 [Chlamydoabsidia padenii]|nr:hypothetical protein BC941DRAFT_441537 [Chlamydoabsidia padenii]